VWTIGIGGLMVAVTVAAGGCGGRGAALAPANPCAHQRSLVFAALIDEFEMSPAPTVADFKGAFDKTLQARGAAFLSCPVCKTPYQLNPVPTQWTMAQPAPEGELAIFCSCEHSLADGSKAWGGTLMNGNAVDVPVGQTPAWVKNAVAVEGAPPPP
jgi:hypothetical protein